MKQAHGQARPIARARRIVLVVAAAFVVSYAAILLLYSPGGDLDVEVDRAANASVDLLVEVVSVDPAEYEAELRMRVLDVAPELVGADGDLLYPLRLSVSGSDGTDDFVLPPGEARNPVETTVGLSGSQSGYPFDRHQGSVLISMAAAGEPISLDTTVTGGVAGWDTDVVVQRDADTLGATLMLGFERSFSTQFFAIMLLVMAIAIGALAFTVGVALAAGHQPVDSSILGWGAGLVFALLGLRFYMPGDPPIGSGIDVFAYMWVVAAALIGLGLATSTWLRRRWHGDEKADEDEKADQVEVADEDEPT